MIGIDLVDLRRALKESNWQRNGYLNKIFTPQEQELIKTSADPDQLVWLLWSMKEAVYKVHSRAYNWYIFAPASIRCTALSLQEKTASGELECQGITYFSTSVMNKEFIHSLARATPDFSQIRIAISKYDPADHTYKNTFPDSVSHHGRYLALAYL